MALYKLTLDTTSVIRTDAAGIKEAEENGFVLEGECDEAYLVTKPGARPKEEAPKPDPKKPKASVPAVPEAPKPDAKAKE